MGNPQKHEPIRISIEKAKELYDKGNVTILDVVDTHFYNQFPYRIQGAVRINPEELPDKYSSLPKDRSVLTY